MLSCSLDAATSDYLPLKAEDAGTCKLQEG
jgi:hypothetical protein